MIKLSFFLQGLLLAATLKNLLAAPRSDQYKVVIIGAGASGLHAAYKLAEGGTTNIAVLEAQDRIGGRVYCYGINNDWIEQGAQWIHGQGNQSALWRFIQQHPEIEIAKEASNAGVGYYIRSEDGKVIPKALQDETAEAFDGFADKVCENAIPGKSMGDAFDEAFEEWIDTKVDDTPEMTAWRRQLYKWWLRLERFDSAALDLRTQSMVSSCNYDVIKPDTSFQNGYQSLFNVWKNYLATKNIPILTKTVVNKINWENDNGKVIVTTKDGRSFEADHVIVTVSLGYLQKHHKELFNPGLDSYHVRTLGAFKMGTVNKIFLQFEKPFWDEDLGFMFLHAGDEQTTTSPVDGKNWLREIIGFDVVMKQPNMLVGWISGPAAKYVETLTDEAVGEALEEYFTELMKKWKNEPNFVLPKLTRTIVTRWSSNPYTLGSYSYRGTDGDFIRRSPSDLAEPLSVDDVPKVWFAGEATSDEFYTAVHGAMQSAEDVARNLKEYL